MSSYTFRSLAFFIVLPFFIGEGKAQQWPVLGAKLSQIITPELCLDLDGGIVVVEVANLSNQFTLRKYAIGGNELWTRTIRCQEWMLAGLNVKRISDGYLLCGLIAEDQDHGFDPLLIKLNECMELEWSYHFDAGASGAMAIDAWELSDSLILIQTPYLKQNYNSFLHFNPYTGYYEHAYTLRAFEGTRFPLDSGTAVFLGSVQAEPMKDGWYYDKLEIYPIDSTENVETKHIYYGDRPYPMCMFDDMERSDSGYMLLVSAADVDSSSQTNWSQLILMNKEFEPTRFQNLSDTSVNGLNSNAFALIPVKENKVISVSGEYGSAPNALRLTLLNRGGEKLRDTLLFLDHLGYEPDPNHFEDLYITSHTPLEDGSAILGGAMRVTGGSYRSFLLRFNAELEFDEGSSDTNTYSSFCTDTLETGLLVIPSPAVIVLHPDSFELTEVDSQFFTDPLGIPTLQRNGLNARIYPNPAESSMYIDLPDGRFLLTLYTFDGRKISSWTLDGGERKPLPIAGFTPGPYLLHVTSEDGAKAAGYTLIIKGP